MIKKIIFIIILYNIPIFAQEKWSLEDCIIYAKKNNLEVQKQNLVNKSFKRDISLAKYNYLPNLNFMATQGFSLGNSYNISTGVGQLESRFNNFSLSSAVPIFNGFTNLLEFKRAKLNVLKGKSELEKIELELSLNITNKYLEILFVKELIQVNEEQELISKHELSRISSLYQTGLKSKVELLDIEAVYIFDKNETLIAKNNLKSNLIELQELIGVKPFVDFDVKAIKKNEIENITYLNNEDYFENNPFVKSIKLSEELKINEIKINKASLYPKVNFTYSYSSSYYHIQGSQDLVYNQNTNQFEDNGFLVQLKDNRTHYLGFSLIVPIFNRLQNKIKIEKSKIELDIIKLELNNQEKLIQNEIEIAYNNVVNAKSSFEAYKAILNFKTESFNISREKYNKGHINSSEFLQNKLKYVQAEHDFIKAKFDYFLKIKILDYYK